MPKFRKKPVVIEAYQFNPQHENWTEWANRYPGVRPTSYGEVAQLLGTSGCSKEEPYWQWNVMGVVDTKEGKHVASPGDWIITGVQGEVYPCKPDIFAATYDAIFDGDSRENYILSQPRLLDLKAELATHGKTCDCAHKKMCEDREEWLIAEINKRTKAA